MSRRWIILLCCFYLLINYGIASENQRSKRGILGDLFQQLMHHLQPVSHLAERHIPPIRKIKAADPALVSAHGIGICHSQPKTCAYLSCLARTFKSTQHFGNVILLTQFLSNPELRRTVINDPEIMKAICAEGGLGSEGCESFVSALQVVQKIVKGLGFTGLRKKRNSAAETTTVDPAAGSKLIEAITQGFLGQGSGDDYDSPTDYGDYYSSYNLYDGIAPNEAAENCNAIWG